jgi:ABC-type glycerol-3-phosphate transport system substrate-binding protein
VQYCKGGDEQFKDKLRLFSRDVEPNYEVICVLVESLLGREANTNSFDAEQLNQYGQFCFFIGYISNQSYLSDFIDDIKGFELSRQEELKWTKSIIEYTKANSSPEKVCVVQSPIPYSAYSQWFMTQLIGGNPVDVIQLGGTPEQWNKYFHGLSSYMDKPNFYNKGTVLEDYVWKDTFIDEMASGRGFSTEYFGAGLFFGTQRLFVNLDILEKATGSRRMPLDLPEWMETCRKIQEYGNGISQLIIPIAVRGLDKSTVYDLFDSYFSQMNFNLAEDYDRFFGSTGTRVGPLDKCFELLRTNPQERERMLAAADIVAEIGRYFGDGFTSMDLEQSKFLFLSGKVAFLPESSFNGYSISRNAPFDVGITRLPPLGYKHKYSKYYTGPISESGVRVGGLFGITKSCTQVVLAQDFLAYLTSYEIDQMVVNRAKWPASVKKAVMGGFLKKFEPLMQGNMPVVVPFYILSPTSASQILMTETLERIITDRSIDDPKQYYYDSFINVTDKILDELREGENTAFRFYIEQIERKRSQLFFEGLLPAPVSAERVKLETESAAAGELFSWNITRCFLVRCKELLEKLQEVDR